MTIPRTNARPKIFTALALALTGALLATPAAAEKPDWAGGGKPERTQAHPAERGKAENPNRKQAQRDETGAGERGRRDGSDERRTSIQVSAYFTDSHREAVRTYYSEHFHAGSCPPGLAKKHNGCMPPGQAKQWSIGHPLPRDVVYYDPPYDIMIQLGIPPEGHRFVRVAADILLIAVGTGMVVDALEDLNRM